MKLKTLYPYLSVLLLFLTFVSCSDDSNDDTINEDGVDLIIGEWLVVSENDYFCGTNNVESERTPDPNQIIDYREGGTWQKYENGVEDWSGTWENIGDGTYAIYYNTDDITQITGVEFPENNTMRFGTQDRNRCDDNPNLTSYGYTVWIRQ